MKTMSNSEKNKTGNDTQYVRNIPDTGDAPRYERTVPILGENLSFSYNDKVIFKDLNFAFAKGERIGIVGESGCGKSTFLKIVAGLLPPTEGVVSVEGASCCREIRKKITIVMQDASIMPLTVKENITFGHEISQERLTEILEATKLTEWIATLPEGVDTYLGDKADRLSGGQAQRLAIARAMAKNVDIVLLDEPTSALDSETAEGVMEALSKLTEGKTVIHVTHQPNMLKGYSRILRMEGGKLYE